MSDATMFIGGSDCHSNYQGFIEKVTLEVDRRPYVWMADDDADAHVKEYRARSLWIEMGRPSPNKPAYEEWFHRMGYKHYYPKSCTVERFASPDINRVDPSIR